MRSFISQKKMVKAMLMLCLFFLGEHPAGAQKKTIPMNSVRGYVMKDTNFSRKDFNVWLITTQLTFDSLFTSVDTTLAKPNFNDNLVLAIKAETVNKAYKTNFRQMYVQRRILKVFFNIEKERPGRDDAGWVSILSFPKDKEIRRVNFYYDDMMIRSIPVVIVY